MSNNSNFFVVFCIFVSLLLQVRSVEAASSAKSSSNVKQNSSQKSVQPSMYNWTGFYGGITSGATLSNTKVTDKYGSYLGELGKTDSTNASSANIGGVIGFNWQFNQIVVGAEADYSFNKIKKNSFYTKYNYSVDYRIKSFATLRGRLGYAFDNFLFYGTAGLAMLDTDTRYFDDADDQAYCEEDNSCKKKWKEGFAIGAGLEVGISKNLSFKGEYLYINLPKIHYYYDTPAFWSPAIDVKHELNVVRLGLNYRF